MVTSPHHLASQAGLDVLREGGTAIEAAIATGACLAVVYPHMNALGGDSFWLIVPPSGAPRAVMGVGKAAADAGLYRGRGLSTIPTRGGLAANTSAGLVEAWRVAREQDPGEGTLPLKRLFDDAIFHAENGVPVTAGHAALAQGKDKELTGDPGYDAIYRPGGKFLVEGERLSQGALAQTLRGLAARGLRDFYEGDIARALTDDLEKAGSPVTAAHLARQEARVVPPLKCCLQNQIEVLNTPPPTQGLVSLLILALFDRIAPDPTEGVDFVHRAVESFKAARRIAAKARLGDPSLMTSDAQSLLDDHAHLNDVAQAIDLGRASPWPDPGSDGGTVWFGAVDRDGTMVSVIQSIYHEYGSGVVLPETGVTWQNRGASFGLKESDPNPIAEGREPFHTLNPAAALLPDGQRMIYGTMGGEGQPQTQSAIFIRRLLFGQPLQAAITAPRWLLGRTWGAATNSLKIEDRMPEDVVEALRAAGHDVELFPSFDSAMGHAGAILRHTHGRLEGATDPRSDGSVAAW
ncbi:gamma-glutamyltranspeptidase [Parvularcula bermudensis HTCC2503]|uniref:Gamma-glutamyltranspeptidase n=2 Tax=Parvularcula TaxID=208215 RepID=E0TCW4_PARBH|nr:gamma-glutamyltranspeptidase [Parvularcula bermudensis HTCC2503]